MQQLSRPTFDKVCLTLPDHRRRLMLFIDYRPKTGYRESFIVWSTGWPRRQVRRALKELEDSGLLVRTEKGRIKVLHRVPDLLRPQRRRMGLANNIKRMVRERDRGHCVYCDSVRPGGGIDHRVPLSRGGANDLDNLAWACMGSRSCNTRKSAHTHMEFSTPKDQWPPV